MSPSHKTVIESRDGGRSIVLDPVLMVIGKGYDYTLDGIRFRAVLQEGGSISFYELVGPGVLGLLRSVLGRSRRTRR